MVRARDVTPIDRRTAVVDGKKGPMASKLSDFLVRITGGREPAYRSLLTPVYAGRRVIA